MSGFFSVFSLISALSLVGSFAAGLFRESLGISMMAHVLVGLSSAILTSALHCLIFAIFTGAGKDTRELVQDLGLNPLHAEKVKAFRKITFPPAMYAILLLVLTSILGAPIASIGSLWLRYLHLAFALFTLYYNLKTIWLEIRCVRENSEFLRKVNAEAGARTAASPLVDLPVTASATDVMMALSVEKIEWGTHVFALGKFLVFLGWNAWLPYLYLRFIMALIWIPVWPFLAGSLLLFAAGNYLKLRYSEFQPKFQSPPAVQH